MSQIETGQTENSAEKKPYPLISVRNLSKHYALRSGWGFKPSVFKAVEDVSFEIMPNETLGLVGESGSGKSTIGRAVTMLNPPTSGVVAFEGTDLTQQSERQMRAMRKRMQMVFQDPYSALNPRMTVGDFVAEPLLIHDIAKTAAERKDIVAELFRKVGLEPRYMARFPHQFSGGQRQRICIARAIAVKPSFIVADEPIAALDVSIQAQVVNLLQDLQEELGLAYLFISHDLRMVRYLCHRVAVIWKGRIVEIAPSELLYGNPLHPYTRRLLSAVPVPDPAIERARTRLPQVSGLTEGPDCHALVEAEPGHYVAREALGGGA
ncbi:dipeptide/oligopeptide/nickel ABC transporter ATP-binding protein [Azorhizobium oxalatiphilum]|uniref:Dipeptide/oligopeptide/nickel ABC transporter ATP-binding protein n=1 Tax=Azorhizobium oxalatiphilum TaxID=980631 RepID=A0A917BLG4_9HYPH|nr:ATP-binding cassette domain-containing protein [Azorhizobium oxalatiphilum]GGF48894.1 dipeptide/oligopeptide/nickel ABC transporter ATP-binding protein [Azorhizobium oxalatiphilum]